MATPKQSDPQFKLRLTHALRDRIEAAAADNNRSMNAEMIARLEESFDSTIFETAIQQSRTLQEQGEALEAQSKALTAQADAMQALQNDVQRMSSALATFAFAFDDAAKGNSTEIQALINVAKADPLVGDRPRRKDRKQ